jgi:stearoyl-CoA desaturase (delta-9 desaturase)
MTSRRFNLTPATAAFAAMHLACLGAFLTPFTWKLGALGLFLYASRMLLVTAGYHRYFSHRSYRTSRAGQCVLAFLAQTSGQKGVLWWAAMHRTHHRDADTERDVHSPRVQGFWWSHVGWILSDAHDRFVPGSVRDLERFPELRFLDRRHWICPVALGAATLLLGAWTGLGAWPALLYGFIFSTVLLWHATFTINSLAHIWGSRRFATPDGSRNNAVLALITFGEGWHNNHHHCQGACRQGIRWWELDLAFICLKLLCWAGLVWDLKPRPEHRAAREAS